jgi:hypothetical protein
MRYLTLLLVLGALVGAPTTARAGIGSLFKAAAKLGKVASKGGTAAKATVVGGVAARGALVVGDAGLSASRVLRHVPDDAARIGLSVADHGAGGVKVVTQAGEQMRHAPNELAGVLDEFDAMAGATAEAGVDVYVDASMLSRLDTLEIGPNTRVLLGNLNGSSMPLRGGPKGVAEVALARSADGMGRLWFRLSSRSGQAALRVAMQERDQSSTTVLVHDVGCVEPPRDTQRADDRLAALAEAEGAVVVLTSETDDLRLAALASACEIDRVLLRLDDVGKSGGGPCASEVLNHIWQTETLGEQWAAVETEIELAEAAAKLGEDHTPLAGFVAPPLLTVLGLGGYKRCRMVR